MTVDLTGVAVSLTGGIFSVLGIVVSVWLTAHVSNKRAAETLGLAVKNSLGAIQQAATSEIMALHPQLPGVPAALAPGVQYVLDQAGPEATQLGITPLAIAQKVEAAVGLANIATNLAVTASPAPVVVAPLDPVPATAPPMAVGPGSIIIGPQAA